MRFLALFVVFFLITTRNLASQQPGEANVNIKSSINKSVVEITASSFTNEEVCGDGEEECLKRRILADAHLDYIYTQNHQP